MRENSTELKVQKFTDLDKILVRSKDKLIEFQKEEPHFGGFLTVSMQELQHIFQSPGPLYESNTGASTGLDSIQRMLLIAGSV